MHLKNIAVEFLYRIYNLLIYKINAFIEETLYEFNSF